MKIAMGSDCGGNEARTHGRNADELQCHVRCGMMPLQEITSTTPEAARVLRLENEVGTIEEGKVADLVVADGDLLEDVSLAVKGICAAMQAAKLFGTISACWTIYAAIPGRRARPCGSPARQSLDRGARIGSPLVTVTVP